MLFRSSLIKHGADRQEQQLLAGLAPGAPGWGADSDDLAIHDGTGRVTHRPALAGDQRRFYQGVVQAIAKDTIDHTAALEAVRVMACLEAAFLAARTGASVGLSLAPDEREA